MTNISWTTETWNPIVGCSIDTKGCTNCYAMRQAWRFSHNPATPQYHGTAKLVNGNPVWTGKMNLTQKAMLKPLHRQKPTTYFVNSMGDLFHENVPDEWIDKVFAVMALCPQHTFQILTKRAGRMRKYMALKNTNGHHPAMDYCALMAATGAHETPSIDLRKWPLPNVWLGVSCEDQTTADLRIPALLQTPAAIRFVSAEPLLGPIRFRIPISGAYIDALRSEIPGIGKLNWVICGGESGPNARPMHPDWARSLRDQCVSAGVPFHFKQWGLWSPITADEHPIMFTNKSGGVLLEFKNDGQVMIDSRKKDYRLLDGREWLQMPEVQT